MEDTVKVLLDPIVISQHPVNAKLTVKIELADMEETWKAAFWGSQ
jgi:hypothetical protein